MTRVTTTNRVLGRTVLVTLNTMGASRARRFTSGLRKTWANRGLSGLSKEESSDKCDNGNLHDYCVVMKIISLYNVQYLYLVGSSHRCQSDTKSHHHLPITCWNFHRVLGTITGAGKMFMEDNTAPKII